jgi:hypothetical protein
MCSKPAVDGEMDAERRVLGAGSSHADNLHGLVLKG